MIDLYEPTDIDAAHAQWKANCGPCSLAAILKKDVNDVRQFLNGFDKRGYMNPTHMKEALHLAGQHFTIKKTIPTFGLAFIQFTGTWTKPGAPIAAAYRHTHWVGVAHPKPFWTFLYDVNIEGGQWVEKMWWEENVLPLIADAHKGADGKYFIRTAIEIIV